MAPNPKDVRVSENSSRGGARKKSADSLPKILRLAARGGTLQRQHVRCGKPNCKCSRGEAHEAFYFFYSTTTGLRKLYVRRADVAAVKSAVEARRQRDSAFRSELGQARAFLRRMMRDAVGVSI